jgi:molybdopterin biosynthesis enzyme
MEQALTILSGHALELGAEPLPLAQALGRALCEDVYSPVDSPPFAKASMDGYAVAECPAESECGQAKTLRVVASVAAGSDASNIFVGPGNCIRIMTGAFVPSDAAQVIRREFVSEGETEIAINRPEPLRNIIERGAHLRVGDRVLTKRVLRASDLAILAGLGIDRVPVCRIPEVAVLSSGSELLAPGTPLRPGMIYDTNTALLSGLLAEMQCPPSWQGHVGDERGEIRSLLASIFAGEGSCAAEGGMQHRDGRNFNLKFPATPNDTNKASFPDRSLSNFNLKFPNSAHISHISSTPRTPKLLLISGGVSVGDYDFIPDCLRELGVETLIDGAAIKPGKRFIFGRLNGDYVFALPGNPMAVYVLFHLFVRPFIVRSMGVEVPERVCMARLAGDIGKSDPERAEFIPVRLCAAPVGHGTPAEYVSLAAEALPYTGSSHLEVLSGADGFILLQAGAENLRAGEDVCVRFLRA